jgi:hypothetical protein
MRRILISILAPTALRLFGLAANAQQYGRWEDMDFLDRVRGDLGRAAASAQPLTGDRGRIRAAQRDISAFQQQRAHANYDPADLDSAIAAFQQVVNSNTMPEHDRDMFMGDLRELRHFRTYYVNRSE